MRPVSNVLSVVLLTIVLLGQDAMCFTPHKRIALTAHTAIPRKKGLRMMHPCAKHAAAAILGIRGGEHVPLDPDLLLSTWQWCANLGAPAALVAGAVLATLIESREALAPAATDKAATRLLKKTCRLLLLTSFGLEVISIFVATVTGTMLLSVGDVIVETPAPIAYKSPIGFLMHNYEFEFLTARMCFLQGLFNWLASVALELLVAKPGEGRGARKMNRFISSCLLTIILGMLSFLNSHVLFYVNYGNMWRQYAIVTFQKFFCPPTPMSFVLVPAIVGSTYLGYKAFTSKPEDDLMEED